MSLLLPLILCASKVLGQDRYWVGGEGLWSDPSHWSTVSGGPGGASLPNAKTDVFFDKHSFDQNGQVVTIDGEAATKSITWRKFKTKAVLAGNQQASLEIHGNILFDGNFENRFDGDVTIVFNDPEQFGEVGQNGFAKRPTAVMGEMKEFDWAGYERLKAQIDMGITFETTAPSCNGATDGQVIVKTTGGVAPLSYDWFPDGLTGEGTDTISGLGAGSFTVFIVDANGDFDFDGTSLIEPFEIAIYPISQTNISCNGQCDGAVNVTFIGGTGGLTYLWDDPGAQTTSSVTGLCAGTYRVVATDGNGCTADTVYNITEPDSLKVNIAGQNLACNGVCTGVGTAVVTGGTSPFTYSWPNTGHSTRVASSLCAAQHIVDIEDANGCTTSDTVTLTEPTSLSVAITASSDASCFGITDGSATALASGGSGSYSYSWSTGAGTATASGLTGGTYTVTATDDSACTAQTTVLINSPTAVSGTVTASNASCQGVCDGQAVVSPSGGNGAPYTYLWTDPGAQTTVTATGLCAGVYSVTVTDNNGCTGAIGTTITEPNSLSVSGSVINVTCNGYADGRATAVVTGGTTPYGYQWNDGLSQTTATATNLVPGTYKVVVSDLNGCSDSVTVAITQPATLTSVVNDSTNITCNGACDGTATVTVGGGTAPFGYAWTSGGSSVNETGICAGSHEVVVTDANGCVARDSLFLTEPGGMTLTTGKTDLTCNGDNSGEAWVSVVGGTSPYTYSWNDALSQTTDTARTMAAGTFTVTVTDDSGCVRTENVILVEPDAIGGVISTTDATCNGNCDGVASVVPSGGNSTTYTYAWDDPLLQTDSIADSLCLGTHNVTITDTLGCTGVVPAVISQPGGIVLNMDSAAVSCFSLCDGGVSVAISGGTAPYGVVWNDPSATTNTTAPNLCAGVYTVTVTDLQGCVAIDSATVDEPALFVATIVDSTDITCFGLGDGTAEVNGTGGTRPYSYSWTFGGTDSVRTSMTAATYVATMTDANGCTSDDTVTIEEPTQMTVSIMDTNISCYGALDGMAVVSASGGTSPYTYDWPSLGSNNDTVSGLGAGDYIVNVRDSNNCLVIDTATIVMPDSLDINFTTVLPSCLNACDGEISAIVSGGTTPYTYTWDDPGAQSTPTATGLCGGGFYEVKIQDVRGCRDSLQIMLIAPPGFTVDSTAIDASCNGVCDGQANFTVTGGTGLINYAWSHDGGLNADSATSICTGNYELYIEDANGCRDTATVTVGAPAVFTFTTDSSGVTCNGDTDGWASVSATGSVPPYFYLWNDVAAQNTDTAQNLAPGTYTVRVTDAIGCFEFTDVIVPEPGLLTGVFDNMSTVSCIGRCDGEVNINMSGGTLPYTYLWNDPLTQTTSTADSLCLGTYTVDVVDSNGCAFRDSVEITMPDSLRASFIETMPRCNGDCDGALQAIVTGGTAPYTYAWDDTLSQTTVVADSLCQGDYEVIITDVNGCLDTFAVTLNQPDSLIVTMDSTNISCFGLTDGVVIANHTGGRSPFTYLWDDSDTSTTQTVDSLGIGTYKAIVTDSAGCVDSGQVMIVEPTQLVVTLDTATFIPCFGDCIGEAQVSAVGGTLPYSYLWHDPDNQTTARADSLCAGSVYGTVIDSNGCRDSVLAVISSNPQIVGSISILEPSCWDACDGGATVTPSGGVGGPYTHSWTTGDTASAVLGLCMLTYQDTITDSIGCRRPIDVVVTGPDTIFSNATARQVTCIGMCDGEVYAAPTGGADSLTWVWDDPSASTSDTLTGLCAGDYVILVTDTNGCTAQDTVTVTEPAALNSAIIDSSNVNCGGDCGGYATVNTIGGTAPYSYAWNDPLTQNTITADSLCAGNYRVIVTDSMGCADTVNVSITDTSNFSITIADLDSTTCFSSCDGFAVVQGSGGTPPYTYDWNGHPSLTNDTVTALCRGANYIQVTDSTGCIRTENIDVPSPDEISGTPTNTQPSCFGFTDGSITMLPSGGDGGPYTHQWDTGVNDTLATVTGLAAGTYHDTITDASGCVGVVEVVLGEPALLEANASAVNISCFGLCDGVMLATPTGGTAPYDYLWSDPTASTNDSLTGLCDTTYRVNVTDANGCIAAVDSATVIEPSVLTSSITDTAQVSCNGLCVGEATAVPAGGTAPYTYLWSDPSSQTTVSADSLCVGSYFVEVTDSRGCKDSASFSIRDTSNFAIAMVDSVANECYGECRGSARVQVSGGIPPYDYVWDPGLTPLQQDTGTYDTDDLALFMCAGTWWVTVTDSAGCIRVEDVIIEEPDSIAISFSSTPISCFGLSDGTVTASAAGGTPPYSYLWDTGDTTAMISGVGAGTYEITVTDSFGCTNTASIVVVPPAELVAFLNITEISCFGETDAELEATQLGGTSPFTYAWDNGAAVTTRSSLGPGTYWVVVTDVRGCTDSIGYELVEPTLLVSTMADSTDLVCYNVCEGSARLEATGGTLPYSFLWDDPTAITDSNATDLCAGTYTAVVTDARGCTDSKSVTLSEPTELQVTFKDTTATDCMVCDGVAEVSITGGVLPYSILWDDPGAQTDSTATGLCATTYQVDVEDANGCRDSLDMVITGPNGLSSSITSLTDVSCNGACDGEVIAAGVGGTPPYNFAWRQIGDSATAQLSDTVSGLCPVVDTVYMYDNMGCISYSTFEITENDTLELYIGATVETQCNLPCTGSADADVTGGSSPFTYEWQDPFNQTTDVARGLCATQYDVYVEDANGCRDTATATVTGPNGLSVIVSNIVDAGCNGASDGQAVVSASGGTPPLTIRWSSGETGNFITGKTAGTYTATVTDGDGCTAFIDAVIGEPDPIVITTVSTTETSCLICTGEAEVSATGGTAPYVYEWNDDRSQTGTTVDSLCATNYQVRVTDAAGCVDSTDVTITGPNGFTVAIQSFQDISCNGLCDGMANAQGLGGNPGYTYHWTTGDYTKIIEDQCAGKDTVTVLDSDGCRAYREVEFTEPDELQASISGTVATDCNVCTGSATGLVNGGTAPYTYSWDDPSSTTTINAFTLCAQSYVLTVRDANGCQDTAVATITGPNGLSVSITDQTDVSCFGGADGSVTVAGTGGNPPLTVSWNDGNTGLTLTDQTAGSYIAVVRDSDGCEATRTVIISEPDDLDLDVANTFLPSCEGDCDGALEVIPRGGTAPLSVAWDNGASGNTASDICAGDYDLTVTDANGCNKRFTVSLSDPDPITVQIVDTTHITCQGVCDGIARIRALGGDGNYTYSWNDPLGQNTPEADSLCAGTYTITVTDGDGCQGTLDVTIHEDRALTMSLDKTDITCFGEDDGIIRANVGGGVTPYQVVLWSNGENDYEIDHLTAGDYWFRVEDNNGCRLEDTVTIIEPALLVATITDSADLRCYGIPEGEATVTTVGGTLPYTYTWTPGTHADAATVNDLSAGWNYILVTDANNCKDRDSVFLTQPDSITINVLMQDSVSCNGGSDGSVLVHATGGTGLISYTWMDDGSEVTNIRNNLTAGTYTVVALDASGCSNSLDVVIGEPDVIRIAVTDTSHILCSGECHGSATVLASGGNHQFTYSWFDSDNTPVGAGVTANDLCLGTYQVRVIDQKSCTAELDVVIHENNALRVNLAGTNVLCFGDCNGKVVAEAVGGYSPYQYEWSPGGETIDSITGLCPGDYLVRVTDSAGCVVNGSETIVEPTLLTADIVDSTHLRCFELCEGTATVLPNGGTPPYIYEWDPVGSEDPQTTRIATGLCAGYWSVEVSDQNGCTYTTDVTLDQPAEMVISGTTTNAQCTNTSDGSISIDVGGGVGGFTFSWTGPFGYTSTTEDPEDIYPGLYTIAFTDGNGCVKDTNFRVRENVQIQADAGNDTTVCFADSVILNASGGSDYLWSTGDTTQQLGIVPDTTTTYYLTVQDSGCTDYDTVEVVVNDLPIATTSNDAAILEGMSATLSATGAGVGGTYEWSPPYGLSTTTGSDVEADPLETTTYVVTATDANGCRDTSEVTVWVVSNVEISSGLTPNGDGKNDSWEIRYIGLFPDAVVQVYNRWGQMVFENKGYTVQWDGTHEGGELPVGTYYFVIDLGGGIPPVTGPITLMR